MNVHLINNNKNKLERTGRCGGNDRKKLNANTVKDKDLVYTDSKSSQNSLSLKISLD